MTRPVRARARSSWPAALSSAQRAAVRRSCQTMARAMGRPVLRSHTSVVSRWLVMPIAATCLGAGLARGVEHHGARAGGALVDGEDIGGAGRGHAFPLRR